MNSDLFYVNLHRLNPGDTIVCPKSAFNLVQHFAIYLGYDDYGNHWVCENVYGKGVLLTRVQNFFTGNPNITRYERFKGNEQERRALVENSLTRLGRPYNLFHYNCEHFANEVRNRGNHSKQVGTALGLTFGLLLLAVTFSGK